MATKPTYKPEWAIDDIELPVSGNPNKVRPEEALRNSGYDQEQHPTAEEFNWMFNNLYRWVDWLEENIEDFGNTISDDYYNKTESDTRFANVAGDTLSGDFDIQASYSFSFGSSFLGTDNGVLGILQVLNNRSLNITDTDGQVLFTANSNTSGQGYSAMYRNGSERVRTTDSGLDVTGGITSTSGIDKLTSSNNGSAPHYAARAWVHFDGNTGTINQSGNIASVVRTGTGEYQITFTEDMADANYVVGGSASDSASYTGRTNGLQATDLAVTGFDLTTGRESGADNDTKTDFTDTMIVVFR